MITRRTRRCLGIGTLAALLALTGCNTPAPSAPQGGADAPAALSASEQIQLLLSQARDSQSPQREQLRLDAIALLLQEHQLELCEELFRQFTGLSLTTDQQFRHDLLKSQLLQARGDYQGALAILNSDSLRNLDRYLDSEQQLRLGQQRGALYARLGEHMASASQYLFIDPLLPESARQDNRDAIWQALMYLSLEELQRQLERKPALIMRGWLELALIAKNNQGYIDQQLRQLEQWQRQWPAHPALRPLPGGLELLKELAANRPSQLALLLPLSDKLAVYGRAIRDGFLAAAYQTRAQGGLMPQIRVYDTAASADFNALYQQAIDDGAQLIIGPLEKEHVASLFALPLLSTPTLALNRVESTQPAPAGLYQFGLLPQDEIRQLAEIVYLENHRHVLVVAPLGEWGEKGAAAFRDHWEILGGRSAEISFFDQPAAYSQQIKTALQIDQSEQRAVRLQRLLGQSLEFDPRRRQDIDAVIMLAKPQQGRSLIPLLAYHYAAELPVYAISRIYSGYSQEEDRDIEGVRFTDIPWVLEPGSELKAMIDANFGTDNDLQRLYALGIDSYLLYPRLPQLDLIPNSRVYGYTGTLKLNSRREIERRVLLAQIQRQRARLIPIAEHHDPGTEAQNHETDNTTGTY